MTSHSPLATSDFSFTNSYLPGANTVSGMTASSGHAWTRSYEPHRNLISAVTNRYGSTVISAFDYANDEIGRRTAISRSGTAFDMPVQDAYGYNTRSEVTSARRALSSNPNQEVRGFSYDYAYDPIGNRITSKEYDHEDNARVSSYTANELNQYEQRTVPGYAGVRGSATNNATVTVNGNTAWRLSEYFYGGDEADNAASAVMKELDITAVVNPPGTNTPDLVQSVTGKVFVAKSPEAFTYDDDGNMLSDGRFVYTWDGENRLASIETSDAAASAGAPRVRVEYSYDNRSRRIGKVVSNLEGETWTVAESRSFLYDNWNMIQEIKYSNIPSFHSSTNSYVWGLDLSGSLQGAGGVGGLLAEIKDSATYSPAWDANGNVMEYVSTDGTLAAHYEYSPFGETIIQSGDMADAFAFRFSTKYWEDEAKLYYYGYRFYAPGVGRWLNRDPIGTRGGPNVFHLLSNNPVNQCDLLGYYTYKSIPSEPFGRIAVEIGEAYLRGNNREITIAFILKPAKHCDCNRVDFVQKVSYKNLEGPETSLTDVGGGHHVVGEWEGDPDGYVLSNVAGRGSLSYTPIYTWVADAPSNGMYGNMLFDYDKEDGSIVKRKTEMSFVTCAVCIDGKDAGTQYGCVSWRVTFVDINNATAEIVVP